MITQNAPVHLAARAISPQNIIARSKDLFLVAALCLLVFASWIPRLRGPIDLRWDAGVYYVLGTSLMHNDGYRLLNEPGDIQAIQYPPGLPALVAAHEKMLGTDDPVRVGIWLRRSWCLLSMFYVAFVFLLSRYFFSRPFAVLISLACLFNYQMLFLSTLCFAELPFACSSVLFGYFYFQKKQGIATQIGAASAALATYLLRTAGIALLIAWVADAILRKQFRRALVRAAVALVPFVLWQSYTRSVESSATYKHPAYAYQRDPWVFYNVSYATNVALKFPFRPEQGWATKSDLAMRFARNLVTMPAVLGEAVSAKSGFWEGHLKRFNAVTKTVQIPNGAVDFVLVPLGLIVCAGLIWMLWHRQWFIPIYLLLTVAAVCTTVWPGQFPRYLAPIEPYALIALFTCLIGLRQTARLRFRSQGVFAAIPIVIAVIVVGESAISSVVGFRNFRDSASYQDEKGVAHAYTLLHYPGAASGSELGLKWLVAHADKRAVVAVSMPQYAYLKTGLKAVMPPLEANPEKAQRLIDSVPITYLALDQMLMEDNFNKRFPALMRTYPDKWRLVFASPGHQFDIYERVGLQPAGDFEPVQLVQGKSLRF